MGYFWNFGDGSEATGERVSHTYVFPGEYQVVLNGYSGLGREAVSRTTVKVTEPAISITEVNLNNGYVSLKNLSTYETNLFGWNLGCGVTAFAFPRDTIIVAGGEIKIPLAFTKCSASSTDWELFNSSNKVFSQYHSKSAQLSNQTSASSSELISALKQKADFIAGELAKLSEKENLQKGNFANVPLPTEDQSSVVTETASATVGESSKINQMASVITLGDDTSRNNSSWWGKIKSWFGR
jgi:PKD repeat protein